jgi:hypothetical protein
LAVQKVSKNISKDDADVKEIFEFTKEIVKNEKRYKI